MSTPATYFGGEYQTGFIKLLAPNRFLPETPHGILASLWGNVIGEGAPTEGGELNLNAVIWADDSREAATHRLEGIGLMLTLPTRSLVEAIDCLREIGSSYYHMPLALPAPPAERGRSTVVEMRPARVLQIEE
jgi:hypothetical protein